MTLCVGCHEIIDEIWVEDPDNHVGDVELSDGTIIRLCGADLDYCEDCADDDDDCAEDGQGYHWVQMTYEEIQQGIDGESWGEVMQRHALAMYKYAQGEEKKH